MKEQNITNAIQALYRDTENRQLIMEVEEEIKSKGLDDLIIEVNQLLEKRNNNKIIQFPTRSISFASTSLMAAAGRNLGAWHSHPIVFPENGFVIDIRKVVDSDVEIDVYIYSNKTADDALYATLSPYVETQLKLNFSINDKLLLEADIYVDESGLAAEGRGYLHPIAAEEAIGQLNIDLVITD